MSRSDSDESAKRKCRSCGAVISQEREGGLCADCEPGEDPAGPAVALKTLGMGEVGGGSGGTPAAGLERVGPFELRGVLGEGGMGKVYRAKQTEPLRRTVALKLIHAGLDNEEIIARFEGERQVLALLEHPNIAHVFDAGTSEDGRPYFVMELVDGPAITTYCDEKKMGIRARLELFIDVCAAVQHAHQKGVIHRDLKPSNILVAEQDGKAMPKVIDFGVAKALNRQLVESVVTTMRGQMLGTPQYMSPEQAGGMSPDVDTRSDIYSLGVVLYELLTGTTPITLEQLREAGLADLDRLLREDEPPRPSLRVEESLEAGLAAADCRSMEIGSLAKVLRGDLDWITLKALEKERERRYETANAIALDVRRYLDDEEVRASPPSTVYRMRKFARRHKVALGAGTIVLAAMVTGAILSIWGGMRAMQAKAETDERNRVLTRQIYAFDMKLGGEALEGASGMESVERVTSQWARTPAGAGGRGWEWYYLKARLHRDELTLRGHEDDVTTVAWSPDGALIASGSADGTIKIWDAVSGTRRALRTIVGHPGGVTAVAWSRDGSRLASIGLGEEKKDHLIRIWDPETGGETQVLAGHEQMVTGVAWSPDGANLASASKDKTLRVWRIADGSLEMEIKADSWMNGVAWSPDGQWLAGAGQDKTIPIWITESGEEVLRLRGHTASVDTVAWSADGSRLASRGADKVVRIWDTGVGVEITAIDNRPYASGNMAWSPDGERLLFTTRQNVRLWDGSRETPLVLRGHAEPATAVGWSPDGLRIVSGGKDDTVKIWSGEVKEEVLALRGHVSGSGSWSPDGKKLVSMSDEGSLIVWDSETGERLLTIEVEPSGDPSGDLARYYKAVWSPEGSQLAFCAGGDDVMLANAETGEVLRVLKGHKGRVLSMAWSPDGGRLATASLSKMVLIWDGASGEELVRMEDRRGTPRSLAWSPDGRMLVAGIHYHGPIRIWDAMTGEELSHLGALDEEKIFTAVAWSKDGRFVAGSGFFDEMIMVWDAETGEEVQSLLKHTGAVASLAWHPDGSRLVSVGYEGAIRIWDVVDGNETFVLYQDGMRPRGWAAWSPDGMKLAAKGSGDRVLIWDATRGYEE